MEQLEIERGFISTSDDVWSTLSENTVPTGKVLNWIHYGTSKSEMHVPISLSLPIRI
jgi:hypothetical protein